MPVFELDDLRREHAHGNRLYHEFLRVAAMSAGLYVLPTGGRDPQQPHTEDEVYYVVAGCAQIEIAGESHSVQAGSVIFVPAGVAHHFHDIAEELSVLVVFAPAEYTAAFSHELKGQTNGTE